MRKTFLIVCRYFSVFSWDRESIGENTEGVGKEIRKEMPVSIFSLKYLRLVTHDFSRGRKAVLYSKSLYLSIENGPVFAIV